MPLLVLFSLCCFSCLLVSFVITRSVISVIFLWIWWCATLFPLGSVLLVFCAIKIPPPFRLGVVFPKVISCGTWSLVSVNKKGIFLLPLHIYFFYYIWSCHLFLGYIWRYDHCIYFEKRKNEFWLARELNYRGVLWKGVLQLSGSLWLRRDGLIRPI